MILNPGNYCISHRHTLHGQTTKQPLSNFELQKSWKYNQLWGLRPDPCCLWKKLYLSNKKQNLENDNTSSWWVKSYWSPPRFRARNSFIFNILFCNLFCFTRNLDIANYVDDNTPYFTGTEHVDIIYFWP